MDPHYKPDAPRPLLFLTAGLLWTLVGLGLCSLAGVWLWSFASETWYYYALPGALLGGVAYWTMFSRIARKNINRLKGLPEKSCFFAFQAWHSYLVIAVMVTLGVTLRHSAVPKPWLAVVYITIGVALLGSSLHYYTRLHEADGKKQTGDQN
jgi:hypothetical protein